MPQWVRAFYELEDMEMDTQLTSPISVLPSASFHILHWSVNKMLISPMAETFENQTLLWIFNTDMRISQSNVIHSVPLFPCSPLFLPSWAYVKTSGPPHLSGHTVYCSSLCTLWCHLNRIRTLWSHSAVWKPFSSSSTRDPRRWPLDPHFHIPDFSIIPVSSNFVSVFIWCMCIYLHRYACLAC